MQRTLLILTAALSPMLAFGWGDLGHQTVAEIAERHLNEKARDFVVDILSEPMAVSAIWPDKVRSDDRFKGFAPYHFFEIPEGYTVATLPDSLRAPQSANVMLTLAPKHLLSPTTSRIQKNYFLKMIIHLAGDVHQPLHIGNGEDMGANLCDVYWISPATGEKKFKNLHTVWDEDIFEYAVQNYAKANAGKPQGKYFFDYRPYSDTLEAKFAQDKTSDFDALKTAPLEDWYQQSRSYHSDVYPDTKKGLKPSERTYCKTRVNGKVVDGKYDRKTLPTLDKAYAEKALDIAERQIYIGGLRLAHFLNEMTAKANSPGDAQIRLKAAIDSVLIKN